MDREVAIKIILPKYANHPDFVRRFEVEAQLIARLEHPHIVPLFDYWRDPQGAYLVMRWLPANLRAAIGRGPWTPSLASRLLEQLASALSVAHRDNIIHRDIKPENILLDEDQNAYLADFSIARDLGHTEMLDSEEYSTSPAYISPEQIKQEPLTPRTDIYSLGIVIYELLTGTSAYPDVTSREEYKKRHLHSPLPSLRSHDNQLPAALDQVLQTATAKDPALRYASTVRFAAAFRAALPALISRTAPQPLTEPLTERELEVLQGMLAGLSNEQVAERLVISRATVKWYVKQIYRKLDTHGRLQTIERAQSLNLSESGKAKQPVGATFAETDVVPQFPQPITQLAELVNPYKGLRAFHEVDSMDFFGRAVLVELLLNRLSENYGERLLLLTGPSGSGKSSVVRAGLIPALRQGALAISPRPFVAVMTPGSHPLAELAAALLRVSVKPLAGLLEQFQKNQRGIVHVIDEILPDDPEVELCLIVDQFEELFTLDDDESTRLQFIDLLLSAALEPHGRVHIILCLRADFYDRPLLYPRLAALLQHRTEVITPLTGSEIEQAIVAPAERVGVQLEAGLLTTIVRDVNEQPGALPLLQYALTELFEQRDGLTLTLAAYHKMEGVVGALSRRADDVYDRLGVKAQTLAKQIFLRLVTPGEGGEDTRRRVFLAELNSLDEENTIEDVIAVFVQYRLLTLDSDPLTHLPTVEIAHEALIRQWHKLHEWLYLNWYDVRIERQLAQAAADWVGGDDSFLASGTRLAQLEGWAANTELALTAEERVFLAASLLERSRQQQAEQERLANEQGMERRSRTLLRSLDVVRRYFWAALLSGLALSWYTYSVISSAAIFFAERLSKMMTTGITFGVVFGLVVVVAGELPERLHGLWPWWTRLLLSVTLGFATGALVWVVYSVFFLYYVPLNEDWDSILLGALGIAVAFALRSTIRIPYWMATLWAAVAIYAPLYVTWTNDMPPLIYVREGEHINDYVIVIALLMAVGSYARGLLAEAWLLWRRWRPEITRLPSRLR